MKPGADQIGVHAGNVTVISQRLTLTLFADNAVDTESDSSMTDTGIIVKAAVGTDEVGEELLGRDEGASLRDHWQKLAG